MDVPAPPFDVRVAYGPGEHQFGDLRLPSTGGPHPVVVSIHGGFWRPVRTLDHMAHTCAELAKAGVASWNFEYRRVGQPGGGWPGTLDDVTAAFDLLGVLAEAYPLDLSRVVLLGFSAGGHLALWLAATARSIELKGVVSIAGVADLRRVSEWGLGENAVDEFLGGSPEQFPDRFLSTSPLELLPAGVRSRLLHGDCDDIIPIDISRSFVEAATRHGLDAELITLNGADHFPAIDPRDKEWQITKRTILQLIDT